MGIVTQFRDRLSNVLTGLGGSLDPSASAFYTAQEISQPQLENSYRTSWLSARCHDTPALDATRAWRSWKADDADVTKIEAEERRLGVRQKVFNALVWSRLYGGSAIVMGGDEMDQPLEIDRIKAGGLPYIHVMTRHQLLVSGLNMDPGSAMYGEPLSYQVTGTNATLHPSRVIRFVPKQLPENLAAQQSGWGDPLLLAIMSAIVDADQSAGSFAALVARAKTDTIEVPGLMEMASTKEGEERLKTRIQLLKAFEGLFSVRILAGPKDNNEVGEVWKTQQVSFTGMPEMQTMFWQAVSGAAGVPMTKLLGMSPGGLNSTGSHDEQNYFQTVSADQEMNLRPRLEMLDEVLIRSALGERPADIWFDFEPLSVDSEEVRSKNALARAQAVKALSESGAVPSPVLEAAARGQLIQSGEYPGVEEAYREYDAAGDVEPIEGAAPDADNDNAIEAEMDRLTAGGMSANDAIVEARRIVDAWAAQYEGSDDDGNNPDA